MVYVTGAVRNPGVYEIAPSSRVYEALNAAGGFSPDADQEAINLAAMLSDGVHIKFPRKGEAAQPQPSAPAAPAAQSVSISAARACSLRQNQHQHCEPRASSTRSREIGPKTGQAIIAYREANGPFRRTEDLMNVKGIGPKKFDAIKDDITIGG